MANAIGSSSRQPHEACQRCKQPLLLDPSIADLNQSSSSLITSSLPTPSKPSTLSPSTKLSSLPPSSRDAAQIWTSAQDKRNLAESFILLSESSVFPRQPPSNQYLGGPALAANLHALLSSKTPISHPLCTECTALLQSELQKQLEELSRERDAYINFERGILRNREDLKGKRRKSVVSSEEGLGEFDIEGTEEEWDELTRRKGELANEEERLRKILEDKERELAEVRKQEERAKLEEQEVSRQEEEFLLSHAAAHTSVTHLQNQLKTAQTHLLLSQSLLAHLEATNVYNDAFQIGNVPLHPSSSSDRIQVGTINGLRLGGRPLVEWDEINAAWGLTALCVDRIAAKVGCVFEGYKVIPLGSFSRLEEQPSGKGSYELYASSDLSPARILHNRRFNHALVSLLGLIQQLVNFGKKHDRGWGVESMEIYKDRISGHSIRLPGISAMQMPTLSSMSIMGLGSSATASDKGKDKSKEDSSGEETWTKACRAVLMVLKRILRVESEVEKTVVGDAWKKESRGR